MGENPPSSQKVMHDKLIKKAQDKLGGKSLNG